MLGVGNPPIHPGQATAPRRIALVHRILSVACGIPWQWIGRWLLVAVGFAAVFGTYFALAHAYLLQGEMNSDEGFYAIAARSAMAGKIPYRDFAYTQMPILPYLNGLAMSVLGFGLDMQRRVNIAWGALGLVAVVTALRQRYGRWEPGLLAAFAAAASPHFVAFQAMGKTHAAAGCFVAVAYAAAWIRGPLRCRTILFAVAATIAVGCRALTVLPLTAAALALILQATGRRQRLTALGVILAVCAVPLLPFYVSAPSAFMFYIVKYHTMTTMVRPLLGRTIEWWVCAPAAILLAFTGLAGTHALVRKRLWTELLLLLGALLGITLPMVPVYAYGEFVLPSILVAGASGVAALWATEEARRFSFRHVAWALPLLVLLHPLPSMLPGNERTATGLVEAARFVRDHAPQGPILAAIPMVAIEAGREVIPGTEMSPFSVMGPEDAVSAQQLRLTTVSELTAVVARKGPAAIVRLTGSSVWNFMWQVPSLRLQPSVPYGSLGAAIDGNYERAFTTSTLEVLLPRR